MEEPIQSNKRMLKCTVKKKETDLYDFLGNLQLGMRILEM